MLSQVTLFCIEPFDSTMQHLSLPIQLVNEVASLRIYSLTHAHGLEHLFVETKILTKIVQLIHQLSLLLLEMDHLLIIFLFDLLNTDDSILHCRGEVSDINCLVTV